VNFMRGQGLAAKKTEVKNQVRSDDEMDQMEKDKSIEPL
jgi:hypothetical protein